MFYTGVLAARPGASHALVRAEFVLVGQAFFSGQVAVGRDAAGRAHQGVRAEVLSDHTVLVVGVSGYRDSRGTDAGQYADRRGDDHRDGESAGENQSTWHAKSCHHFALLKQGTSASEVPGGGMPACLDGDLPSSGRIRACGT